MPTTVAPAQNAAKAAHISLFDWLKPRRSVAVARLKNNGFALVVTLIVTQLAPAVPSATTCLWMLITGGKTLSGTSRWLYWIELAVFAVLSVNILQSYIALRYPPPPCEPLSSPAKRVPVHTPSPSRPLKGFTPRLSQAKSPFTPLYSSITSTPAHVRQSPLSNSSPSSFQSSLNSSFSSSILSSPLAYRSHRPHTHSVRSLRGSLLSQFESADDEDL